MSEPTVRFLDTGFDALGESPVWDWRRERLYWIDAWAPTIRWYEPAQERHGAVPGDQLSVHGPLGSIGHLDQRRTRGGTGGGGHGPP